ncbi:MAG: cysteine synthase A [Deltaproteobacteria bacterium]|uniref:Cysteine synthase n=1 Tax=Candidatus Zymogenus saltonus TaxID=2844893 RepID=A0A9D8PKD5_9DELT|nr:cysteine synthase A [Candidatus Zymogenus saltonus]
MIYGDITALIGSTPLVRLNRITEGINAEVLVKLESKNPGGSVKDRIALSMIRAAMDEGRVMPGKTTIIEPTSGNTGIGLALVGAAWGIRTIIVMPDTMSLERRSLLKLLGAELVLVAGEKGIKGVIEEAERLGREIPNSFIPMQFKNPENPNAHRLTTAQEIFDDTGGKVDILVAGVGTGGTITGTASALKKRLPNLKAVAVEPESSPVMSGGKPGAHKIQGIGAGFIPEVMDMGVVDEIIKVSDDDAVNTSRLLAKKEGILCGISSGACAHAALEIAKRKESSSKTIVAILPDTGERYLTTDLVKGL